MERHPEVELSVAYFEDAPDDSPWELPNYLRWESVMPGYAFGYGRVRSHWNQISISPDSHDVVILNGPITALTTQRLMHILARGNTAWFFWGEYLLPRTGGRGLIQRRLCSPLSRADGIVAIGKKARSDYQSRFPSLRVANIPYTCDLSAFRHAGENREASETLRLLFAGQMIERKGIDLLLRAFERTVENGIDAQLDLVGREGFLPQWMSELGPQTRDRITWHGFQQPSALPKLFGESDVFVLPSRHDGWGVVVNEALGAGLPIISTTAVGAASDLLSDGSAGILVEPESISALEDAIRCLALDKKKRSRMSLAAFAKSETLSPESTVKRWLEVIESAPSPLFN